MNKAFTKLWDFFLVAWAMLVGTAFFGQFWKNAMHYAGRILR
jgi:hypothetical protein